MVQGFLKGVYKGSIREDHLQRVLLRGSFNGFLQRAPLKDTGQGLGFRAL